MTHLLKNYSTRVFVGISTLVLGLVLSYAQKKGLLQFKHMITIACIGIIINLSYNLYYMRYNSDIKEKTRMLYIFFSILLVGTLTLLFGNMYFD